MNSIPRDPGTSYSALEADEPPPFFTTWRRVYLAVIIYLFVMICTLYALTRLFASNNVP